MYIAFSKPEEAIPKYFNFYLHRLKVGLVTVLTGSTFLKTGCGKSFTALRMGELIDEDFGIHKVAFFPREFLQILDAIEESGKPGQVVILDEGEISAPATLWYSFTNKAIHYTLSTFRYLRSMAIIVTPSFSWIDKRIRTLTSHWGYTEKEYYPDKGNKIRVKLRLYRIKTDLFGEKIFFEKLRMYDQNKKGLVVFNEFVVKLPSEKLREEFLKKDKKFKADLRKELVREIEKFERYQKVTGGKKTLKDLERIAKKVVENPELRERLIIKGRVYPEHIRLAFPEEDLTFAEARIIARLVKKLWSGKK